MQREAERLEEFAEQQSATWMQTNRRSWQSLEEMRLAAEQECAPAQCNLGLCYETGRGVRQNVPEAVKWFCRAARAGDTNAQHNLGMHYASLEAAEQAAAQAENPSPTVSGAKKWQQDA